MLSPFLIMVVVDVIELATVDVLNEILYSDDFAMMSETVEGIRNKLIMV